MNAKPPRDMKELKQRKLELPAEIAPLAPPQSFIDAAAAQQVIFEPGDLEQLGLYLALLAEANEIMNLTAIRDAEEAWTRHVLDSLSLVPFLVSSEAQRVIDVGSGGGLPGIPLAIALPEVHFTLLESTGKKAVALALFAQRLRLSNVTVVGERAEVVGQDHHSHRERYDTVIARAVGTLPVLLELTVPLAKLGGFVLAIKGEKAQDEVAASKKALHMLHASVNALHRTSTGTILVIEKLRTTPRIYPRKPGEPKRAPL